MKFRKLLSLLVAEAAPVVINVGYENAVTEPAHLAVEQWKKLVDEKSGGTIDATENPISSLCNRSSKSTS